MPLPNENKMATRQVDDLAPFELANVEGLEEGEKDVDELDSGAYGIVFKVTANNLPCMAKRLHQILINRDVPVHAKNSIRKKFRDECVLLSKLNHPNIVHFVGVCYGKSKDDLMLIMERLQTDVATYVERHPNIPISIKVSILLDVSYGLIYLHGQTPPIVHRDLTAPNVLLTSDLRAKIADLGVSKVLSDPLIIKRTVAPGNPNYMAPETKVKNPRYDVMIDIFSFGHLALHIAIQQWPKVYEVENYRQVEDGKMEIAKRQEALEEGIGKGHPLYQLAISCLCDNPKLRPSTSNLNRIMNQLSNALTKKTQLVAVEKLSLEEQCKLKEKQLEIMATEKAVLEQKLGHEKANCTALTLELEESKKRLEEMAAEKVSIDNELSRMRASSAALALKVQEGRQQLEVTIADLARLSDEVLAKTQQVKQYKKQNNSYKFRLEETAAELNQTTARLEEKTARLNQRLEEAQKDFQEQIKRMEEDHQIKIEMVTAQLDSDKKMELAIVRRDVTNLQVELRQWKTDKMSEEQVSEALRIEVKKRDVAEQKFEAALSKCNLLLDKSDSQFQAIQLLQGTLAQHGIRPPRIDVEKISTSMQKGQPRQQATPPVSQHASQYDQHAGYSPAQQPASPYQPHGQQLDPSRPIRAVAPSTHPSQPQYSTAAPRGLYRPMDQQNRGQVQGSPLKQQYPPTSQPYPPTSHGQPSQQYPPTSQGYQTNQRQLPTNQGYHGNQGYIQNQQFPPTNQPHNIPNQPWGQNQGHPPNQRPPPATRQPYTPPNQGQVGGGEQSHGAGVRNPNPSPTPRARVGSHGAYIGGGTANPPYDARQGQGSRPVAAPRGGRKSDPTPPTGQSDKQPAQPEKREKEDTAVQENVLLQGIDDDIHQAAEEVQKEDDDNEESLSEVPLDPNLVCPMCMKQFRLGQIQKYKRHVEQCYG